jgi:hypothetical protein
MHVMMHTCGSAHHLALITSAALLSSAHGGFCSVQVRSWCPLLHVLDRSGQICRVERINSTVLLHVGCAQVRPIIHVCWQACMWRRPSKEQSVPRVISFCSMHLVCLNASGSGCSGGSNTLLAYVITLELQISA